MSRQRSNRNLNARSIRRGRRSVIVTLNVPWELNRFIPSTVSEPRLRLQQKRSRHIRIPLVVKKRGVLRRSIRILPRFNKQIPFPVSSFLRMGVVGGRRPPTLTHYSASRTLSAHRGLRPEIHRRRYVDRKSRRSRVSDGHLNSVRRDYGLLGANARGDVSTLGDAALVMRAVFGD